MATGVSFLLLSFLLFVGSSICTGTALNRGSFPTDFVFGTAAAAYQYEGAANKSGRGPSIWDTYTHQHPERIDDGSNGDLALDFYNRYEEDIKIMKKMNLDAFRFSISWSRILPDGKLSGGVNEEGIKFYNNLIDEILANGLVPYVTIFHWDLPQTLENEYGGFLSARIVDDFKDYAELCYKRFGDRVKYWITFNEPWSYSNGGYNEGTYAPGRCSSWMGKNCTGGDAGTEPYLVTHHQLLAHAAAFKIYKEKYQVSQEGKIGITLVSHWMVPYSQKKSDHIAAKRAIDFMLGWFMDPLMNGDYPRIMRLLVKNRLPEFSKEQSKMLKGSFDFLGLNYYTAKYVANAQFSKDAEVSYTTDNHAILTTAKDGIPIGPGCASNWLYAYPRGLRNLLLYIKRRYNNPIIYITENGISEHDNSTITLEEALNDESRIDYYQSHLSFLNKAIQEGADTRGYFAWSLLDNFEWHNGFAIRFGFNYVDYRNGLKRYPKRSAIWFTNFLKK